VFHADAVGRLYFGGRHLNLIPDRCGEIIDRALSIRHIDHDVIVYVEKI
jgi:hypothetical protein